MSAIAGILHLNDEPVNLEHGRRMMKELEKYPADDVQTWHNDNVFLGCHAQWITPESLGEKLPYYDHERRLAITADAIIDNREELFERLQVDKRKRKDITDSELILLSYHKWGEDSPKYLVGDFAFMIWDERNQKLFGARDFSGARTLYFYHKHQLFAFCTTMGPLFSLPYVTKVVNEEWIAEYFSSINMIETIEPFSTVFLNIEQIPPAHTLTISHGKVRFLRYITLDNVEKLEFKEDTEYEEAFREVFEEAVDSRLRTMHSVGAQLSGGLDSGSVVSFAARALKKQNKVLHTFSYVPEETFVEWTPKHRIANETPYIRSTVNFVGNIKDNYFDFKGQSSISEINDLLEYLEMPYKFFENSLWIKGIYEKAHLSGMGILLEGSRGNYSISWGPALEYQALLLRKIQFFKFYQEMSNYSKSKGISKSRIFPVIRNRAFNLFQKNDSYVHPTFTNSELLKRTKIIDKIYEYERKNYKSRKLLEGREAHFSELMSWSIDGVVNTKLSLQYSMWKRDPTNDLRVIKFCLSLPASQFVRNGLDRALIRRTMKGYLPDNVRLNQHTRGIQGVDTIHRMRTIWLGFLDELRHYCNDGVISNFLNTREINNAILRVSELPPSKYVFDPEFTVLTKSLILGRFLKKIYN